MIETRRWENLHIPLWLIKDTCWMMEWRYFGMIMVIPTVLMALYILKKSLKTPEFYINLAIVFWITGNSYWMGAEFFDFNEYKDYAIFPFCLGFASVAVFYMKGFIKSEK